MQYLQLFGKTAMRNAGFVKIFNYGQKVKNRDLPVKQCGRLRAKCEKLRFARKSEIADKTDFCNHCACFWRRDVFFEIRGFQRFDETYRKR